MYSSPPTLSNPNGQGGLLCSSTMGPIAWWPGNGLTNQLFDTNTDDRLIYQIIPSGRLTAQVVNDGRTDVDVSVSPYHNGLFTCRRNSDISTAVPVGFYQRNGRRGELICVYNETWVRNSILNCSIIYTLHVPLYASIIPHTYVRSCVCMHSHFVHLLVLEARAATIMGQHLEYSIY